MIAIIIVPVVVLFAIHLYSWNKYNKEKENVDAELRIYSNLISSNWNYLMTTANIIPKNELATSVWLNSGLDKQFDLGPIVRRIKVVRALNDLDTTRLFKDKIIQYNEQGDYCINEERFSEFSLKKSLGNDKDSISKILLHIIRVANSLKNQKTTQSDSDLKITGIDTISKYLS